MKYRHQEHWEFMCTLEILIRDEIIKYIREKGIYEIFKYKGFSHHFLPNSRKIIIIICQLGQNSNDYINLPGRWYFSCKQAVSEIADITCNL